MSSLTPPNAILSKQLFGANKLYYTRSSFKPPTCAIVWNRSWHGTRTIFAIVHHKLRSKIGVRSPFSLSNNFDHAFSAFLNQSSEYPVRTFAICENEVYGVIQQVSDLAWIDFDLDVPVILPSCSAHSANLSSAQEVSGRQKIKVNPT